MSFDVGELVGKVRVDSTGVGKGLRDAESAMRGSMKTLEADGAKGGKAAGAKLKDSYVGQVKDLAKRAAGAFAAAKIADAIIGAVDAASNLNETVNKSNTIFGSAAASMDAWGNTAADNLGLSKQAALETASTFGDMFQQIGFAQDSAADMSRTVVQMAADFGSFNNLGTEDVLERISAGFRGEYDSLQKLVPNINAARVEQEAMALSGAKNAKSLTAQQKAQAVLSILQKDGARAMGDFAKTSDGKANADKRAAAAAQDLAAKVGGYLLPAFQALSNFIAGTAIPALSGTVDFLGDVGSHVMELVAAFNGLPGPLRAATLGLLAVILLKDKAAAFGGAIKTHVVGAAKTAGGALDTLRLRLLYASDAAAAGGSKFRAGSIAMQGMKAAGSGLLSVMGGPWGAAFTAAISLVGAFYQHQQNAKQSAEEFANTLDKQTGAITENSREWVANRLAREVDPADIQILKDEGLAWEELTAAIAEGGDRATKALAEFDRVQEQGMGGENASKWQAMGNAINFTAGEAEKGRERQKLLGQATKDTGMAAKDAASPTANLGDEMGDLGKAAEDADTKLRDLYQITQDIVGANADARAATRGYQEALDAASKSLKDNGKAHSDNTEKGRANNAALDNLSKAALDSAKANWINGSSLKTVSAAVARAREDFIGMAVKMGYSKTKAAELATQAGLTSTNVANMGNAVKQLPPGKTITVNLQKGNWDATLAALKAKFAPIVVSVIAKVKQVPIIGDIVSRLTGQAYGGILDDGVQSFAGGGMRLPASAMIARDGANFVQWAEKGTGGEAFIPLAPSRRARSLAVWEETGRRLGAIGQQPAAAQGMGSIAVYVQNPWTGEYLLTQAKVVARDEIGRQVASASRGIA